jgi:hypothetical protein
MKMHTHEAAKAASTPTSAAPSQHSGLLPLRAPEESDLSLLPSENWLQLPSSLTPTSIQPSSVSYRFGAMAIGPTTSPMLQRKLAIGQPNDRYEQEADRVADQVMRMSVPDALARGSLVNSYLPFAAHPLPVQKQELKEEDEEKKKGKIQAKEESGQTPKVTAELEEQLQASQGRGQPLPEETRSFMESRFGQDFGQVRVHTDDKAVQLNKHVGAQAFTHGSDIYHGAGKSHGKDELTAHELTHVVQQTSRIQKKLTVGQPGIQQSRAQSGAFGIHAIGSQGHHVLLQRTPAEAEALISQHTSWGNLDETWLGRELLRLALDGQLTLADEVLNALGSTDRDDVAYEFMLVATDPQLVRLAASTASRQFLHRIFDELTSGSVADEEQQQADRILQVTARQTVSVGAFEAAATSRRTKIFPFRLPGFTVLDDAPIEARRERGGVWVHSYVRVAGTAMFRAETATLPTEYFLSGIVLPETEVIGVRLYDQGGIIHYTTPLFLIQLANATDQRVLEKILEAAGIGLTLGSGALAGLGVEASMAARVLLWVDRGAFALGTVTSVLREHRSWLVEQFGSGFMDAVDIIHSATAIYGLARVALQAPRIIQGLRNSYRAFREAARSRSSGFSSSEQATIQQVTQSTDELIDQIDNIQGARRTPQTGPQQAAESAPLGESAVGRPQAQPAPPTVLPPAATRARELARQTRAQGEPVIANMGGAGASHEPRVAININNQAVGRRGIPNHVEADASNIGQLFDSGSVDQVVGYHMPPGVINWQRAVPGVRSVLRSGGSFRFDWRGANPEAAEVTRLLQEAGFHNVENIANAVVTAVRP